MASPSAPQSLTVDFASQRERAATQGLLRWNPPANLGGRSLIETTYEIAAVEGATFASPTWIPGIRGTESMSILTGLKRGTQYTFGVRARNPDGVSPVSSTVTVRTPICSLHNMLFFSECVNYLDDGVRITKWGDTLTRVRAVGDNDYRTFTEEKDLNVNIARNGNPTRVDAVFIKGIAIEGHSAVPMGGSGSGYSNRLMPATVQNWEGTSVSTVINGFQHDLYLVPEGFTATDVRLTFTGASAKIYEVMLLEFGIEIDANADFLDIRTSFEDRTGIVNPDDESPEYRSPLISTRDTWRFDCVAKVQLGKTLIQTPEEFVYWWSANRNHTCGVEPTRFPWRIFPALFLGNVVPIRYQTDDKTGGEVMEFQVAEQ